MAITITLRHENGKDRAECTSFLQANSVLRRWSDRSHPTLGYDKIDFHLVDAERELSYQGRYDLEHWSTRFADLDGHVTSTLAYLAGTGQPRHYSAEQYAAALKNVSLEAREQAAAGLVLVNSILQAEMLPVHNSEDEQEEDASAPRM